MRTRGTRWTALGIAAIAFLSTGCPATSPSTPPVTTPVQTGLTVWALGDSQGANSNDPARGLPWSQRIGADVGNGADAMYGAGWTLRGTYTQQTILERATALAQVNTVREFVVMAGINDLTGGRSVADMLTAVGQFSSYATSIGAKVTWVGVVPLPRAATISNREADRRSFNSGLAQRFGGNYVDCSSSMADTDGFLRSGYSLSPIDLHLNDAGEQALAGCITAFRSR